MMDILNELQTVGLTALFNPTFLFLLILLFFLGKLVGWMTRNINIWKFLALAYFGIFLFRPLQDAGLIIGGVFILGVASMYMDLFRGIFGWAGGIGDVVSAFRFNGAYKDIQRLEREVEELKSQMRASQMAGATAGGTAQQSSWRAQSQARKSKAKASSGTSTGGRSDGGSPDGNRGSRSSQGAKSKPRSQSSSRDGSQQRRSASGSTSSKSKPRSSSGARSSQHKSTSQSSTRANPHAGSKARASASQSQKQSQSSSQSNQKTAGSQSQGRSQNQSGAAGAGPTSTPSPSLRDKHLTTLELTPGQIYTQKELKAAWRKMAFKTHPDRGGSAAAFAACLAAYRALT